MAAKNQNTVVTATQKTEPGAKKDALATALAQIEKQFGKGAVMKLGDNASMQVDAISTGSLGLDLALGVGGVPRGRIIEVYGPESSGKTTLALHILAEAQKKGGEVVPSFYIGATFGCAFGPLLGLPAGFSAAVGLVSVFCGATNTLIPSILLAYELFGGVGLELIALGCGVCYMLSGTHGLYSSQLFVTEKLLSEYTESWGKRLHH